MKYRILLIVACTLTLLACQKETRPEPIKNLYLTEFQTVDSESLKALFQFLGYGELTDSSLSAWQELPINEIFGTDVVAAFPTLSDLEHKLGGTLANAKTEGLNFPQRKYAAVVWGNMQKSIAFVDSTMLIALNHYLGANYAGYSQWPEYMRRSKTSEHLPYDIAEALIAMQFPFEGQTAQSRMLYEGALIEAKMRLVPDASLANALAYSDDELAWLDLNYENVRMKLINDRLLFSTSQSVISRLVEPAPTTNIIAANVPGRAGRYIGYKMLSDYLERNPDTALATMLSPEFYGDDNILQTSK